MILISTAGFSYADWVGPFYPQGTPKGEMLPFFARFFPSVELNYSYYTLPDVRGLERIRSKAPGMRFALKAHKCFTHERNYGRKEVEIFRGALDALNKDGSLIALLLQFPYSFHAVAANLDYLDDVTKEFAGYPLAVEFRHNKWKNRRAFDFLQERGLALVTTDAPEVGELFRGGWEHGGPFGYVRLHGRNAEKWYNHEHAWERYDYLYSPGQISKLAEALRRLAGEIPEAPHEDKPVNSEATPKKRDVFVFFNNHWLAQGVINAMQLRLELGEEPPKGLPDAVSARLKR